VYHPPSPVSFHHCLITAAVVICGCCFVFWAFARFLGEGSIRGWGKNDYLKHLFNGAFVRCFPIYRKRKSSYNFMVEFSAIML
jgi:hypothetical protein